MGSRSKSSVAQASVSRSKSLSEKKAVQGDQMVLMLLLLGCAMIEATQKVNTTEIRLESGSGLKKLRRGGRGHCSPLQDFPDNGGDHHNLRCHRHRLCPHCPPGHLPLRLWLRPSRMLQTKEQGIHPSDVGARAKNDRNLEAKSHSGFGRGPK